MNWVRVAVLGVFIVTVAGCHKTTCEQGCDGCCSTEGECLTGTSRFTCGTGGVECAECGTGRLCTGGQCVVDSRIDPDSGEFLCNCISGCCTSDGGCEPGTQREACGDSRTMCVACGETERCEKAACTSAACTGCLDLTDVCQTGTSDTACGTGGGLCLGCAPGSHCVSGGCVEAPCNVATCATGCCNIAQRCVQSSAANCGFGGQACTVCASGLACVNGSCG